MLEILRDVVERALEPFADFFNLLGLNHKRWRKHEPIADDTQHEAMTFRGGVHSGADVKRAAEGNALSAAGTQHEAMTFRGGGHSCADVKRAVEGNALFALAHELHAENETLPAHIPDNRMLAQPSDPGLQPWAEALGARNDVDLS